MVLPRPSPVYLLLAGFPKGLGKWFSAGESELHPIFFLGAPYTIWHLSQMIYKSSGRSRRKMLPPPNWVTDHPNRLYGCGFKSLRWSMCPRTNFKNSLQSIFKDVLSVDVHTHRFWYSRWTEGVVEPISHGSPGTALTTSSLPFLLLPPHPAPFSAAANASWPSCHLKHTTSHCVDVCMLLCSAGPHQHQYILKSRSLDFVYLHTLSKFSINTLIYY